MAEGARVSSEETLIHVDFDGMIDVKHMPESTRLRVFDYSAGTVHTYHPGGEVEKCDFEPEDLEEE